MLYRILLMLLNRYILYAHAFLRLQNSSNSYQRHERFAGLPESWFSQEDVGEGKPSTFTFVCIWVLWFACVTYGSIFLSLFQVHLHLLTVLSTMSFFGRSKRLGGSRLRSRWSRLLLGSVLGGRRDEKFCCTEKGATNWESPTQWWFQAALQSKKPRPELLSGRTESCCVRTPLPSYASSPRKTNQILPVFNCQ